MRSRELLLESEYADMKFSFYVEAGKYYYVMKSLAPLGTRDMPTKVEVERNSPGKWSYRSYDNAGNEIGHHHEDKVICRMLEEAVKQHVQQIVC